MAFYEHPKIFMHMPLPEKILFAWSGGKDSAMAFYELKQTGDYEISTLLTTVTEDYGRVSMHGVRRILLEQQAESLGISLETVSITKQDSLASYEEKMRDALAAHKRRGIAAVAFGDIFLEDLRRQREENLSTMGMHGIFPLWKRNTTALAHAFIDGGFKAIITCVDSVALDKKFAGRTYDKAFLRELPSGVDPCGENGEFHSFVYDGPPFRKRIAFTLGEKVLRDNRFYFCDLVPVQTAESKMPAGR